MKKITRFLSLMAALATLLTVSAPAGAATFTPGTQDLPLSPGHGFPRWYTEPLRAGTPPTGGLSLDLCRSQTPSPTGLGPMCVLLAGPAPDTFVPTSPIVFSTDPVTGNFNGNFPSESFYAIADALIPTVGQNRARYRANLEGAFGSANGLPAAGQQITFARVRYVVDAHVNGTYRITHPFGRRVFTNVTIGNEAIKIQEDVGIGALGGPFANIVTPDQPNGNLGQFLVASGAPGGQPRFIPMGNEVFIGDPNLDQNVTGATFPDPDVPGAFFNSFMVEIDANLDGIFEERFRTDNFTVAGKVIGLSVAPQAGTDFGVLKLGAVSSPVKTFNVTNVSPAAVTPTVTSSNIEFTVSADTCAGVSVLPGGSCSFAVTFAPATIDGLKSSSLTVTAAGLPPVTQTVTGTGDSTAPNVAITTIIPFTNLLTQTILGTVADNAGGAGVASVQVSVIGGATQIVTPTNGAWSADVTLTTDAVNVISVTATDLALPLPGNTSAAVSGTITVDRILPVVTITDPTAGLTKINTPSLAFTVFDTNRGTDVVKVDGVTVAMVPVSLGPLADGPHTVRVESTDKAGNIAIAKEVTITVDTGVSNFNLTPVTTPTRVTTQTIGGTVEAGSTVMVNGLPAPPVTGATWRFDLAGLVEGSNSITVTATDLAGNTASLPPTSIRIILQDGNIDESADRIISLADALKALKFAAGLLSPTTEDLLHADVAPLVNGKPSLTPNGKVDIGDVVLILRKHLDPASW